MTNDDIDKKVLAAIMVGKMRASAVHAHLKLASGPNAVDRSLQRLRRKGLIEYSRVTATSAGWRPTGKAIGT